MNPADNYAQLKSAVLGAQQAGGVSPLGNFAGLDKLYAVTSPSNYSAQAGQVAGAAYNANVTAKNQQAEADAAAQAAKQKLKDISDPSKYQQVAKQDGGYGFYDPLGNEISASEYASITKKSPADILKQSQNPIDISFRQDYNNLQDYINAKVASKQDSEKKATAQAIEQQVKKQYGVDLGKMNIQEVLQKFQQAYPTVFGGNKRGVTAGQTLVPGSRSQDIQNAALQYQGGGGQIGG